jgi:secondary thiamine-phosphate synthase enzyme
MQKINLKTSKRTELIDITEEVQGVVLKSRVKEGVCLLFCPHTTAGLTINENADPSVKSDILWTLNKLIPEDAGYSHQEGNADSHVKSSLFGSSLMVFIEAGELAFGNWQGIYFCEGDGPRQRQVWVKIVRQE